MSETTTAWLCLEVAELLRRVEEVVLDCLAMLGNDLSAGIKPDATIILSADTVSALAPTLMEIAETGERLRRVSAQVPRSQLRITYEEVRDGAASALADGIVEARTALLAARVLDVPTGWTALGEALLSTDAHSLWSTMTPEELLGRFRGATAHEVREVVANAGIGPETTFAACEDDHIARLASGLLEHARR